MRPQQQPLPSIAGTGGSALVAWAAFLLALAPLSALAQSIFPPNEPRTIYSEDVSSAAAGALPAGVSQYDWTAQSSGVGSDPLAPTCGGGFWGTNLVQTEGKAGVIWLGDDTDSGKPLRAHPLGPQGISSVFVVD